MIDQVRVLLKSVTGEIDTPKAIWRLVCTAIGYVSSFFASAVLLKDLTEFDKLELLRQHRAIRQEVSDRIFAPIQSSENGGILYVFPIFGTAEVGQKDG